MGIEDDIMTEAMPTNSVGMEADKALRLEILSAKAATPEGLTLEESREVIAIIREGRVMAAKISAKSKAKKAPIDSNNLLNELEGL